MVILLYMACIIILFAASWTIYGSDAAFLVFLGCILTTIAALTLRRER